MDPPPLDTPAAAPVSTDAAADASAEAPNHTLYINNLNEKLKKGPLKKLLYSLFAPFGRIVDVVVIRTDRLRGQAWVAFADVAAATKALRQLQGFPVFDKPLVRSLQQYRGGMSLAPAPLDASTSPRVAVQRVRFARDKSHAVLKMEGAVVPVEKRRRAELPVGEESRSRKMARMAGPAADAGAPPAAAAAAARAAAFATPNNVLLVTSLPSDVDEPKLRALFASYAGLRDMRLVRERGLAFVEYEHEAMAAPALMGLLNHPIAPGVPLVISYARK